MAFLSEHDATQQLELLNQIRCNVDKVSRGLRDDAATKQLMDIIDDDITPRVDIVIEQEQGLRTMVCHKCYGEIVTMGYVAVTDTIHFPGKGRSEARKGHADKGSKDGNGNGDKGEGVKGNA